MNSIALSNVNKNKQATKLLSKTPQAMIVPGLNDVTFGRGLLKSQYPGNRNLDRLIHAYKDKFKPFPSIGFWDLIVSKTIRNGGRFLIHKSVNQSKHFGDNNEWVEISRNEARMKVASRYYKRLKSYFNKKRNTSKQKNPVKKINTTSNQKTTVHKDNLDGPRVVAMDCDDPEANVKNKKEVAKQTSEPASEPTQATLVPGPKDVIFGVGVDKYHLGNKKLDRIVEAYKNEYKHFTGRHAGFWDIIVSEMIRVGIRFFFKTGQEWVELSRELARVMVEKRCTSLISTSFSNQRKCREESNVFAMNHFPKQLWTQYGLHFLALKFLQQLVARRIKTKKVERQLGMRFASDTDDVSIVVRSHIGGTIHITPDEP